MVNKSLIFMKGILYDKKEKYHACGNFYDNSKWHILFSEPK